MRCPMVRCVYRCVAERLLCPRSYWIDLRSAPEFNICVAKEWRIPCGLMRRPSPDSNTYLATMRPTDRVVRRVPRWFINTDCDGDKEPACANLASLYASKACKQCCPNGTIRS